MLVFRNTDYFKIEKHYDLTLDKGLSAEQLGEVIRIKRLGFERTEDNVNYFKEGQYNSASGEVNYAKKEYPYVIDKLNHLHKARHGDPLYFLNIFFGVALLFFVVSAFFMFLPKSAIFRKGLLYTMAGAVLTLILLYLRK